MAEKSKNTGTPFGPVDLLYSRAPWNPEDYSLLILIAHNQFTAAQKEKFTRFLKDGGTLVVNRHQCTGTEGEEFLQSIFGGNIPKAPASRC